jgi:DNA-binding NtrC family response regulator
MRRTLDERALHANVDQVVHSTNGESAATWRELSAGRPDGLLLVDGEGIVRHADRGAHDLLGGSIEGKNLGRLVPGKGLEAFVRDAHSENREGFRFDLHARNGRAGRSLSASVVPIVVAPGETDPGLRVVLLLDAGRRRIAAELLRMQEYTLPRREVGTLLDAARLHFTTSGLVGSSTAATLARAQVAEAAHTSAPVLIVGAPGTGRQHIARTLHYGGGWGGPFLALDCSAFSREHLESELFGQVKGAFADASFDRPGALQQAAHGTVYLDDIEHLPPELQAKLLRALREHVVTRAGSEKPETVDTRIIASTTVDLAAHGFDQDLLQALSGVEITLPPLRERREDVADLARHFLHLLGGGRRSLELSADALYRLENYDWPSNVRELRACIERACKLATSEIVGVEVLSAALRDIPGELPQHELVPSARPLRSMPNAAMARGSMSAPRPGSRAPWEIGPEDPVSLELYEKKCLLRAIAEAGGNKLDAAHSLKVGKSTLYRKLKKYDIH